MGGRKSSVSTAKGVNIPPNGAESTVGQSEEGENRAFWCDAEDQLREDEDTKKQITAIEGKDICHLLKPSLKLFCRRCLIFNCRSHSAEDAPSYPFDKRLLQAPKDTHVHNTPCLVRCYMTGAPISGDPWSDTEFALPVKGIQIFGQDSCCIEKNLLSDIRTCSEIHWCMKKGAGISMEQHQRIKDQCGSSSRGISSNRKAKPISFKTKRKRTECLVKRKGIAERNSLPVKFLPCHCGEGKCKKETCSCIGQKTWCEKFCSCSRSCSNRIGGCKCRKGECWKRSQCICYKAGRECDPDECVECCKRTIMSPDTDTGSNSCKNMSLRLGFKPKVVIARSGVHGLGVYAGQDFKRHEFIGEYRGEIISLEEAEIRGSRPGRQSTFLMELNDRCCLDGSHELLVQ